MKAKLGCVSKAEMIEKAMAAGYINIIPKGLSHLFTSNS
jgi:hypothetical protein